MKTGMPRDYKNPIGYWFWNLINRLVVRAFFREFEITGLENMPSQGPFLLVANHSSRWDGLVIQYLLNTRANYMVSPNEIKGMQKPAVLSVGAFPANPRLDLVTYCEQQFRKGEPVVIFPEGNVFNDGQLHKFKRGAAKVALHASGKGVGAPVIPVVISYQFEGTKKVKLQVERPIDPDTYKTLHESDEKQAVALLTDRLFHDVLKVKQGTQPLPTTDLATRRIEQSSMAS